MTVELAAGDRIDRFEVVEVLGRGGRATVYRVRHVVLGTEHALKVVPEPSGDERARLLREARAQASLRHGNVVPVLDVVASAGIPPSDRAAFLLATSYATERSCATSLDAS